MKVLVVGSGGREHALAYRVAASDRVEKVYVAPGNAGSAREPGVENIPVAAMDFEALVAFGNSHGIDLTIIGPEQPLVAGVVDRFNEAGLRCFGPTAAAARLEGSKSYAKAFLEKYGIPTASYRVFDERQAALAHLARVDYPVVVKADGLAAGKGVVVARSAEEAEASVREMLSGKILGGAGSRLVIEEFLVGEEASFIVMADGEEAIPFSSSQDHKAARDGDEGPNTGGMGACSPAPVVTPAVHRRIMDEVIHPTIRGMSLEGTPYLGFLYAGLMIDEDGAPRVVEFNCRFGDPEAQPVLLRMTSDLPELCIAAIDGSLAGRDISFDPRASLALVLASGGYPGPYETGTSIEGLAAADAMQDVKVFHAGTSLSEDGSQVSTSGGRVLGVTAIADTLAGAQQLAYRAAGRVRFDGVYYRSDIGYRAVARERTAERPA